MYCPAHFEESRPEVLQALIQARPLATLVTIGDGGLAADHLPLTLEIAADGTMQLRGHVARANPMWRSLRGGADALAIFQGAASYISPSWYPGKREHGKAVPTWNYVTVHAHGRLRAIDDTDWLRRQVDALTRRQESGFAEPWAVTDAPADYIEKMLGAIVGVELTIGALCGKWKTSQNQPAANRNGAAQGLRALGGDEAVAMAALIERG
ncbi:MAG TPA: FMN-binding negative transcriptional regulator [Azospira sp.]|nr:FMN-binding negative transcriptional regulator [Azospira sp.]